jgi:U4/U6.U5 tri-snRNP-associated protein 1
MSILLITGFSVAEERTRSEEHPTTDVVKAASGEADGEDPGGLVFDDTSEFVRGITYDPITVKKEAPEADGPVTSTVMK